MINGATCNAATTAGCGQTPPTVTVGFGPAGIAFNPANRTVVVTNIQDTSVSIIPAFDWMALWPLLAKALASKKIEEAAEYARRMLSPPQQTLREPVRGLVDAAVQAWDNCQAGETEELLCRAVQEAGDLGYL